MPNDPKRGLAVVAPTGELPDGALMAEPKLPAQGLGSWMLGLGSWQMKGWQRDANGTDATLYLTLVGSYPERVATLPCAVEDVRQLETEIPQLVDAAFDLTLGLTPRA